MAADRQVPTIKVSGDGMEAFLTVAKPKEGESDWNKGDLLNELEKAGITYGIDEGALDSLIVFQKYDSEVLVATGTPPTSGKDGYYIYHFSQDFSSKPMMRPDGSVDYRTIHTMELVEEGQLVATYVPAEQGTSGWNVKGREIPPQRCRDLVPLRGKGFVRSEDGKSYFSAMVGKIIKRNDDLIITPVHEVKGNADLVGGDIDFRGDVIVHGDVLEGVTIKARGTITVEGVAEQCYLESQSDIYLLKGVKGSGEAVVTAKGNITAAFVEYSEVNAEGNIQADVFFDSQVSAGGSITLTGKRASVIGGTMTAVEGIVCENLGNNFGIRTCVKAGIDAATRRRIDFLKNKIETTEKSLETVEASLAEYDRLEKTTGRSYRDDPKRTQLLRTKLRETSYVQVDKIELERLYQKSEKSRNARVVVNRTVYPGVRVEIEDMSVEMGHAITGVEYYRSNDRVEMVRRKEDND